MARKVERTRKALKKDVAYCDAWELCISIYKWHG